MGKSIFCQKEREKNKNTQQKTLKNLLFPHLFVADSADGLNQIFEKNSKHKKWRQSAKKNRNHEKNAANVMVEKSRERGGERGEKWTTKTRIKGKYAMNDK